MMARAAQAHAVEEEKNDRLGNNVVDPFFARRFASLGSNRVVRAAGVLYDVVDRTILMLGFIALATGIVTYGGHFVSSFQPLIAMGTSNRICRKASRSSQA